MKYYKHITIFIFSLLILSQISYKSMFVLWYQLDNASFENRFCVNKDKPASCCKGSCFINQLSEKNNDNPLTVLTEIDIEINYFLTDIKEQLFYNNVNHNVSDRFCIKEIKYKNIIAKSVFHPPKTV